MSIIVDLTSNNTNVNDVCFYDGIRIKTYYDILGNKQVLLYKIKNNKIISYLIRKEDLKNQDFRNIYYHDSLSSDNLRIIYSLINIMSILS